MHKSIFELWLDRELPEPLKTRIDSFSCQGKTFVEWVFRSGFYIGKHIEEYNEWVNAFKDIEESIEEMDLREEQQNPNAKYLKMKQQSLF